MGRFFENKSLSEEIKMIRISEKQLKEQADRISGLTGASFSLNFAYGKVAFMQVMDQGGERMLIGYGTKREVFSKMLVFLEGFQMCQGFLKK